MKLSILSFIVVCLLFSGTAFANGIVVVQATGTCGDGSQVTGQGSGADPAEATDNANKQIVMQCATRGLVESYDSAEIIRDTRS